MVRISLLPPELEAERQARRRRRQFFLGSAAVLSVFVALYLAAAAVTVYSNAQLRQLETERAALEVEMARYQKYARMQAEVERLKELATQAIGRPPAWRETLQAMGLSLPEGVWLTDFNADWEQEEKKRSEGKARKKKEEQAPRGPVWGELTLRGRALSHGLVALWLRELEHLSGVEDVRCEFATEGEVEGCPLVEFEVKARVEPAPAYRLVGAPGGGS
ncbi:MAG TPA: hypothetical protein EYP63_04020 [Desulfotomaculum sp.]|nr:hypothetical protein [Desulfotomaculum sp.]